VKLSKLAKIFKALSSEQRLEIFEMLYQMGKSDTCCMPVNKGFSKACGKLQISPSTISHHFKELENAGLITCERDGQTISCTVNTEALKLIQDFIN
jgi:ArsR family transcriptional regulator, arsenate/arsenite/antimonite-responsive transcriptional repressor